MAAVVALSQSLTQHGMVFHTLARITAVAVHSSVPVASVFLKIAGLILMSDVVLATFPVTTLASSQLTWRFCIGLVRLEPWTRKGPGTRYLPKWKSKKKKNVLSQVDLSSTSRKAPEVWSVGLARNENITSSTMTQLFLVKPLHKAHHVLGGLLLARNIFVHQWNISSWS